MGATVEFRSHDKCGRKINTGGDRFQLLVKRQDGTTAVTSDTIAHKGEGVYVAIYKAPARGRYNLWVRHVEYVDPISKKKYPCSSNCEAMLGPVFVRAVLEEDDRR